MKNIILVLTGLFILMFMAEVVNFFLNSASPSSKVMIGYFIKNASRSAQKGDLDATFRDLEFATKVNLYGNHLSYKQIPMLYLPPSLILDPEIKEEVSSYLSGINVDNYREGEDMGLGKIYYDLGLMLFESNPNLTPLFLEAAIYNNPEFPAFHAEYINYFFSTEDVVRAEKSLAFCFNFKLPTTLCNTYKNDNFANNRPAPVGYLSDAVESHYIK